MEYIEVTAKTVNDAITEACQKFVVTSDKLDYVVVEEGSSGSWNRREACCNQGKGEMLLRSGEGQGVSRRGFPRHEYGCGSGCEV